MLTRAQHSPSASTVSKTHSVRSHQTIVPASTIKTVVTTPPWARDEPPSPTEDVSPSTTPNPSSRWGLESRPSDGISTHSSSGGPPTPGPSRWWTFARPALGDSQSRVFEPEEDPNRSKPDKPRMSLKDRSMSWLSPAMALGRNLEEGPSREKGKDPEVASPTDKSTLQIPLPQPPAAPYTLSHNKTPGWSTPWSPKISDGILGQRNYTTIPNGGLGEPDLDDYGLSTPHMSPWQRRRKKIRKFLLTNTYAPLVSPVHMPKPRYLNSPKLFRFVNISFTSAALAVAVRIRTLEKRNGIMGAVGASPTLVVIFAPLTLVHVMMAIYSEYFGRPLGLWRTSAKLAHTLVEVVFICAWSASLALAFDNFFTSVIPCAAASSISWYNGIPRTSNPISGMEGSVGERICDNQVVLICLVGVGLIMYCINLVISLYRIFEKVKYRPIP
ncbi:hypothetical protein JAAARDRAFT_385164 [Jaapia argillacea MUCL 33604]|uniref:Uncharacterized protein n=1 Tax=Jaapia argillacea MUCL 33604 TaxID=933084 RepID=A0A067Q9J2_9AGAM|nr:hypothetical protein JAAARDRAFT_385164 [Jaapia argillacea MUCL 33604]